MYADIIILPLEYESSISAQWNSYLHMLESEKVQIIVEGRWGRLI